MFRWADVRILYLRELRSALRERNIVVNSILLPIFLYPALLWLLYTGFSFVSGQTEGFSSRIMVEDRSGIAEGFRRALGLEESLELLGLNDPVAAIHEEKLDLLLTILPAVPESPPGNFTARLTFDDSKDRSRLARTRIQGHLSRYRDRFLESEGGRLGLAPSELQIFWVTTRNVATSRQMGQFLLGLMLPIFLIVMLAVGCIYPAIDSTAGEREKSTWETLMTVATSRFNIVAAKYLYVATMSCMAGLLNLAAMTISMKAVLAPILGDRAEGLSFRIPLEAIPLIVLVTVLLGLFIAAGMMILASFARTFKEGQSMVSPFYIGILLPAMLLQVPGLEFTPLLALIPIVNVTMVFRESISGVYHWPMIGLTLFVELACVVVALWLATVILRYEDFVLGSYSGRFTGFIRERVMGRKSRRGKGP